MHGGAEEMHGSPLERYIHMRQGEFKVAWQISDSIAQ